MDTRNANGLFDTTIGAPAPPLQHMGQVHARGRIVPIRRMDLTGIRRIYSYSCGICDVVHVWAAK